MSLLNALSAQRVYVNLRHFVTNTGNGYFTHDVISKLNIIAATALWNKQKPSKAEKTTRGDQNREEDTG